MNTSKWLMVIVILAVTIFGLYNYKSSLQQASAAQAASMPEPAATVTAIEVKSIEFQKYVEVNGEVQAFKFLQLNNELAGQITHLDASSGSHVKKGQVLIVLDHRDEDARLMAAKATLMLHKQTHERYVKLQKSREISEDKVDQARAAVQIAQADIDVITTAIDKKILRAPFSARVGIHTLEVGQYLDKNSQVLELVGVSDFTWIDFNLPQFYQELSLSSTVKVSLMNQTGNFNARIIAVNPQLSSTSRHLKYRAQVSASQLALKPNTLVSVTVPIADSLSVISVPDLAIKRDALGEYVFSLIEDVEGSYRANLIPVELGERKGDQVMVLSGLESGQLIANKGSFKLFPGMKVYVTEEVEKATSKEVTFDASAKE